MPDYITLMGSEDVSRAGSNIREAASTIYSAAGNLDQSCHTLRQILEDSLNRFEELIGRIEKAMQPPPLVSLEITSEPEPVHNHVWGAPWYDGRAMCLRAVCACGASCTTSDLDGKRTVYEKEPV